MKAFLVVTLSALAAAQAGGRGKGKEKTSSAQASSSGPSTTSGAFGGYPSGWVDFNGGDTSGKGEMMKKMMGNMKPPSEISKTGGSGKYKAKVFEDPSLSGHTIYAPKEAPVGKKLPLLLWGNGGCMALGQTHGNVLTDISSHGYVVIANGAANPPSVIFSKNTDMFDAALWAATSGAKYNIDVTRVASAGQSCGGMQAYTANQTPGIKTTIIFNSGLLTNPTLLRPKLDGALKGTILYMEGGTSDVGYKNGKADYHSLTQTPAVFLSQNTGHAVNKNWHPFIIEWLNWQLKGEGEATAKSKFLGAGSLPPFTEHMSKNWK